MDDLSFRDFVLDQLSALDEIEANSMFGGYGFYHKGFFFGIAYKGALYFKTDEGTRRFYIDKGMNPFSPSPKVTLRDYYQVPVEVLESSEDLQRWARDSINVQRA